MTRGLKRKKVGVSQPRGWTDSTPSSERSPGGLGLTGRAFTALLGLQASQSVDRTQGMTVSISDTVKLPRLCERVLLWGVSGRV